MTGVLVSAQGMCVYLPVYLGLSSQGVSCGGVSAWGFAQRVSVGVSAG